MKVTELVEKLRKIYPESMVDINASFISHPNSSNLNDPFFMTVEKYWSLYISDITHTTRFHTFDDLCKYVTEINIQHITENELIKETDA